MTEKPNRGLAALIVLNQVLGILFALALALALMLFLAPSAGSQQALCLPYPTMLDYLKDEYAETLRSSGITPNGRRVEMYANAEAGTFSFVIVSGRNIACIAWSGEGWRAAPAAKPEEPLA